MEVVATDIATDKVEDRARKVAGNIFQIDNPYKLLGKQDVLLHLAWREDFKYNSESYLGDLSAHYRFISEMTSAGTKRVRILGTMH